MVSPENRAAVREVLIKLIDRALDKETCEVNIEAPMYATEETRQIPGQITNKRVGEMRFELYWYE